jgi:putative resolvase
MKSSQYARKVGIGYITTYPWWKAGTLDAYQTPTGTVVVRDPQEERQPSGQLLGMPVFPPLTRKATWTGKRNA